ncbi:uncharacterized protein LOC123681773 [Harmonia axyridis]|uniref:uncharacterized protein LOC123681773 n=1 Tax=Harmonia axyridis TaxID=115357 RepID=UPI001E276B48|nr:uncharacterized protein LOC123681773 [Harmonia axyridis]
MPAEVRNLKLKIVFTVHFILIALSTMGYWSTSAFLFYNSIFCFMLIWGIHAHESEEPIQMALIVNIVSIALDIFIFIFSYPADHASAREKFSAVIAIFNLLTRPASSIILFRLAQLRGSSTDTLAEIFTRGTNQTNYEDMDRSTPPAQSSNYDFASAERI